MQHKEKGEVHSGDSMPIDWAGKARFQARLVVRRRPSPGW